MATACSTPKLVHKKTTQFPSYPSASALAYKNQRLYMLGDDATTVLILDGRHCIQDSIPLVSGLSGRIAKDQKPDYESMFAIPGSDAPLLIALGSFSTPQRNRIAFIDPVRKKVSVATLSLAIPGIEELNIEGATLVRDQLLLSNRANQTHRTNHFIVTSFNPSRLMNDSMLRTIPVTLPPSEKVIGISDIIYYSPEDLLLFTASTEDTPNAYTDGVIGESYLGVIKQASQKITAAAIKPDEWIVLTPCLQERGPQKIEAVAVEKGNPRRFLLHLATDNDNGQSTLFKLKYKL